MKVDLARLGARGTRAQGASLVPVYAPDYVPLSLSSLATVAGVVWLAAFTSDAVIFAFGGGKHPSIGAALFEILRVQSWLAPLCTGLLGLWVGRRMGVAGAFYALAGGFVFLVADHKLAGLCGRVGVLGVPGAPVPYDASVLGAGTVGALLGATAAWRSAGRKWEARICWPDTGEQLGLVAGVGCLAAGVLEFFTPVYSVDLVGGAQYPESYGLAAYGATLLLIISFRVARHR